MTRTTLRSWAVRALVALLGTLLLIPGTARAHDAQTQAAGSIAFLMLVWLLGFVMRGAHSGGGCNRW